MSVQRKIPYGVVIVSGYGWSAPYRNWCDLVAFLQRHAHLQPDCTLTFGVLHRYGDIWESFPTNIQENELAILLSTEEEA